jgi:transposase InsO family protein
MPKRSTSEGEGPEVGPLGPRQRWSLARKRAVVMRMLRGESVELLSRALGVPVHKLERWRDKAEAALDGALKEREGDTADADLLAAIRADLARSPWSGEGHRKVWARLRVLDGLRVARKRVLRLMRENMLLSPHRARPRPEEAHDRRIVTDAPNVMWATDGTQIPTVRDGKVWLFGVAEHWNAELVGWHVTKHGTRAEALQAMSMAVSEQFGHLGRDAARGLALRHDHGSAFMSDYFQRQVKAWGMTPSYAFVAQPETNGVIERLFRTLVRYKRRSSWRWDGSPSRNGSKPSRAHNAHFRDATCNAVGLNPPVRR